MEPDRVTYSSSACRDVRSWLMMLYVLSVLSLCVYPNAHTPNWVGKLRWWGSWWERCRRIRGVWGRFGDWRIDKLANWRIDPREVEELKNKKKRREDMKNKLRSTAGGIKQNTLRQGFCLLSFNFNCLFSLNPVCFNYYQPPLSIYTVLTTLTWIIHVLVSVLLSKTTLPLIPFGHQPNTVRSSEPRDTPRDPPQHQLSTFYLFLRNLFWLLCALRIRPFRKC